MQIQKPKEQAPWLKHAADRPRPPHLTDSSNHKPPRMQQYDARTPRLSPISVPTQNTFAPHEPEELWSPVSAPIKYELTQQTAPAASSPERSRPGSVSREPRELWSPSKANEVPRSQHSLQQQQQHSQALSPGYQQQHPFPAQQQQPVFNQSQALSYQQQQQFQLAAIQQQQQHHQIRPLLLDNEQQQQQMHTQQQQQPSFPNDQQQFLLANLNQQSQLHVTNPSHGALQAQPVLSDAEMAELMQLYQQHQMMMQYQQQQHFVQQFQPQLQNQTGFQQLPGQQQQQLGSDPRSGDWNQANVVGDRPRNKKDSKRQARRGPRSGSSDDFGSDDEPERDIRKDCDIFGLSEEDLHI